MSTLFACCLLSLYLQPDLLFQDPWYSYLLAKKGLSTPTYSYANNSPLRFTDETGLSIICNRCPSKTFTIKNEDGIGWESQGSLGPGQCKEVDGLYRDDTFKPSNEKAKCSDGETPYVFKFRDPGTFSIDCGGNLSTNNPLTAAGGLMGGGWRSKSWAKSNSWPTP